MDAGKAISLDRSNPQKRPFEEDPTDLHSMPRQAVQQPGQELHLEKLSCKDCQSKKEVSIHTETAVTAPQGMEPMIPSLLISRLPVLAGRVAYCLGS